MIDLVLASSRKSCPVLVSKVCSLFLSMQRSFDRWSAAPMCALLMQVLSGCLTSTRVARQSQVTSDGPESIWNPSCTQHPLARTSGPAIRGKPLSPPYLPQLPKSWAENPTLRRAVRVPPPPWPGYLTLRRACSSSSADIQLHAPNVE